jgi:hypothetical protein
MTQSQSIEPEGVAAAAEEEEFEEVDGEEEAPPPREVQHFEAPDGWESVGSTVLGYYDPDKSGAIQFTMTGCRLLDNTQDTGKSSCIILAELLQPATLITNAPDKNDQVPKEFPAGTGFGIWAKAGMRELSKLQGAHVWMALAGFQKMKDDGTLKGKRKKSPMAVFKVKRNPKGPAGRLLELLEDARKDSLTEAAKVKTPPWHLIVCGEDYGFERASRILETEIAARRARS